MEITIKEIQENLRNLPTNLLQNVNDYIDFLKSKYSGNHYENLSESQKEEILNRVAEMERNPANMKPIENLYKALDEE